MPHLESLQVINLPLIDNSNAVLEDKELKKRKKKFDSNFEIKLFLTFPDLEEIAAECTKPRSILFERGRLSDPGTQP